MMLLKRKTNAKTTQSLFLNHCISDKVLKKKLTKNYLKKKKMKN